MYKLVIILFLALTFLSCNDCKDRNCENGYCLGDACICDAGFTGENCDRGLPNHYIQSGVGFYTTCGSCAGLSVSVNGGSSKTFTYFFFSPSANCGHEEVLRFNLNPGTHSYTTNDGRSGNFVVEENKCKTILID